MSSKLRYEELGQTEVEQAYGESDLAARIIEELPEESFREGYEILTKDSEGKDKKEIEQEVARLGLNEKMETGWKDGRAYGGAAIIFIPENLADLENPIDLDNLKSIKNVISVSRYELVYQEMDLDPQSLNFGHPLYYTFIPSGQTAISKASQEDFDFYVHWSWVIRFDGSRLTRRMFITNNYWHGSVLTRAMNWIRNYDTTHDSVASAMQDFSIAIYKLKNLADMVSGSPDGEEGVIKRMNLIQTTRSIARAVVVDSEEEDFKYGERSFTGVPDVAKMMASRMVSAADHLPHTKLLGESPSGLGASGDSEKRDWYDFVKGRQKNYLKPKLDRALKILCSQKEGPTNGVVPDGLEVKFHPLWQMSDTDKTSARVNQSRADQIWITEGVLDPEEVRESRFGSGEFSLETKLDPNAKPVPMAVKQPGTAGFPVVDPTDKGEQPK